MTVRGEVKELDSEEVREIAHDIAKKIVEKLPGKLLDVTVGSGEMKGVRHFSVKICLSEVAAEEDLGAGRVGAIEIVYSVVINGRWNNQNLVSKALKAGFYPARERIKDAVFGWAESVN